MNRPGCPGSEPRQPENAYCTEIAATPLGVRQALFDLRNRLSQLTLGTALGEAIELVLAEVLNNVVEHAMAGRSDGIIRLSMDLGAHSAEFELCDDGMAMPGNALPPMRLPDIAATPEDLPEGGFGWYMIGCLTRNLRYVRQGNCNILRFCIPHETGNP